MDQSNQKSSNPSSTKSYTSELTLTPNDKDSERILLGCLIAKPELIPEVHLQIKPEDFFSTWHKIIFESILNLQDNLEPYGWVQIKNNIKSRDIVGGWGSNWKQLLQILLDIDSQIGNPYNYKEYLDEVLLHSKTRSLIQAWHRVVNIVKERGYLLEDEIQEVYNSITNEIMRYLEVKDIRSIYDILLDLDFNSGKETQVPQYPKTGIYSLDSEFDLFERGTFTVVAARPRMGKTSFMRHCLLNVAKHNSSLVFTLEEPPKMIAEKIVCSISNISYKRYRKSQLESWEQKKITENMGYVSSLNIDMIGGSIGIHEMKSILRKLHALNKTPRIIFIDHLQQMKHDLKRGETLTSAIARTTSSLQKIAQEYNCAVILLAQLNRSCEQRETPRPFLSDLRDSGSIEQDAFNVLFIWEKDAGKESRMFYLAKHKNGPTLEEEVQFKKDIGIFGDTAAQVLSGYKQPVLDNQDTPEDFDPEGIPF